MGSEMCIRDRDYVRGPGGRLVPKSTMGTGSTSAPAAPTPAAPAAAAGAAAGLDSYWTTGPGAQPAASATPTMSLRQQKAAARRQARRRRLGLPTTPTGAPAAAAGRGHAYQQAPADTQAATGKKPPRRVGERSSRIANNLIKAQEKLEAARARGASRKVITKLEERIQNMQASRIKGLQRNKLTRDDVTMEQAQEVERIGRDQEARRKTTRIRGAGGRGPSLRERTEKLRAEPKGFGHSSYFSRYS